jgi:ribose/xylose/arabinose/galactoside ABC-type transport system permease subunit
MSSTSNPPPKGASSIRPFLVRIKTSAGWSVFVAVSALIVLVVIFALTSPVFLTLINFANLLRQLSTLLVVALAGTFVIMTGSIDLSVGSIVTLAGISTAMAVTSFGSIGLVVALLAGTAVGAVNGLLHAYARLPSFIVTLGMLSVADGISLIISAGSPVPMPTSAIMGIMGGTIFGVVPVIALWALGIWAVMWFVSSCTVFGRQVVAVGDGEQAARLVGIPVRRIKLLVFVLAGLLSSIAGLLLAVRTSSGSPGMGVSLLLSSIAAIVIGGTAITGGIGGPPCTLIGALTITVLNNGMTLLNVDPFYQEVASGAVVIIAVYMTIRREEMSMIK